MRSFNPLARLAALYEQALDTLTMTIKSEVRGMTTDLLVQLRYKPPEPDPFVSALLIATQLELPSLSPTPRPMLFPGDPPGRTSQLIMGASAHIKMGVNATLELVPQYPLRNGTLIVFCDIERVQVQVYRGVDLMSGGIGPCPLAYIPDCSPGVKIHVVAHVLSRERDRG